MKSLLLMRHAKSSWKDEGLDDHERPLNRRGKKDAPKMGALLLRESLVPDLILCSSALRATTTAKAVAKAAGHAREIVHDANLYFHGADAYLKALSQLPDDCERVLLVGHNPDVEDVFAALTNLNETMPTAAIAHIALPVVKWSALADGIQGELLALWCPKELGEDADAR